MKKLLFILGMFISLLAFSQERTISNKVLNSGETYLKYTGVAADTLKATNQDTIDLIITNYNAGYVEKIAVKSRFDIIVGADTTVAVSVFGKEFDDDATWVEVIASTLTSAVTANNVVQVLSNDPYTTNAGYVGIIKQHNSQLTTDTLTVPAHVYTPFDKSYRYYRIRYIIKGNDSIGTGIKLDEVEFKIYN